MCRSFSQPFPKVDFCMHFGCLLAPLGSLLTPFGSLLAPFGPLFTPFGSLLVPFGSLLLTLGLHFLTFGVSWCRFWTLSCTFQEKIMKYHVFLCFSKFLFFFRHPIPQDTCRLIEGATLRKHLFLCTASSPTQSGATLAARALITARGYNILTK